MGRWLEGYIGRWTDGFQPEKLVGTIVPMSTFSNSFFWDLSGKPKFFWECMDGWLDEWMGGWEGGWRRRRKAS